VRWWSPWAPSPRPSVLEDASLAALHGIGANCLWPLTAIATAAVRNLMGGEESIARCHTPQIVADAAAAILRRDPTEYTGNAVLVEDVVAEEGITDLAPYSTEPGQTSFVPDFFVDPARLDRPAEEILQAARALGR
jgi:citronellol/citronellal dehydrogenase